MAKKAVATRTAPKKTVHKVAQRKTSTALARPRAPRPEPAPQVVVNVPPAPAPAPAIEPESQAEGIIDSMMMMSETPMLSLLGMQDIKLSEDEERVLSEPVNIEDLRVKPTGAVYLSHPTYTRWFNRAFGRLGWAIRPAANPRQSEKGILMPFLLYIHGKPVAFAFGEQDYYGGGGGNRDQTYGDAVEATVASGLRRCAKRLGVGLELWDRSFTNQFLHEHCVKVKVATNYRGTRGVAYRWRRKADVKLPHEIKVVDHDEAEDGVDETQFRDAPAPDQGWQRRPQQRYQRREQSNSQSTPGYQRPNGGQPCSPAQAKRLFAIVRNSGRDEGLVKEWLRKRGYSDYEDVARKDYDYVCSAIEADGPLP